MAEERYTTHGRALLYHLKHSVWKSGVFAHGAATRATTKLRSLPPVLVLLLGICIVSLHAAGIIALVNMGLGGLSLHNPLVLLLIGLSLIIAVFKLTHVLGFARRKGTPEKPGAATRQPFAEDEPSD